TPSRTRYASMPWRRSSWVSRCCPTSRGRVPIRSAAICALSARPRRAWELAARSANGNATSAVTRSDTRAARQATTTARAVTPEVTRGLGLGGVADAADGTDHRALPAELGPYLGHVHVDGTGAGVRGVPPHRGQQLVPGEHPAGPAEQVRQQVELGRRQGHRFPTGVYRPATRVEDHLAGLAYPLPLRRPRRAAQYGLDPGDQLARAERLGQVVVGALLQAED